MDLVINIYLLNYLIMADIKKKDELELLLAAKIEKYNLKILEALKSEELSQRKWLKNNELMDILPLSNYRFAEMCANGLLDYQKIGRSYFYTTESISRLVMGRVNK